MDGKNLSIIQKIIEPSLAKEEMLAKREKLVLIIISNLKEDRFRCMFRPDYLDMFQEIDLVTSNLKLQTFNFQKKLLYCRTPINNKLIPINRQ